MMFSVEKTVWDKNFINKLHIYSIVFLKIYHTNFIIIIKHIFGAKFKKTDIYEYLFTMKLVVKKLQKEMVGGTL